MAAYVVNPAGATHSVDESQMGALLQQGFRLATPMEVAAWYAMQGLEVPDGGASEHGRGDQPAAGDDRRSRRRKPGLG